MKPQIFYVLPLILCFFVTQSKKKRKAKPSLSSSQSQQIFQYIFIGFGIIIMIGVLMYLLNKRSQLMRSQKIRSIKRALQVKQQYRKQKPCTMTQMQKSQAIAWFEKYNWILQESQGKQSPTKIPLKIISVKRKQQTIDESKQLKDYYDAFYVQMKGGSVMVFGVIMFEKYYPTILFEKSISNAKNDSGYYNYKFFDGVLKKGQFEGRWYTSDDNRIQQERQALKEKQMNNSKNAVDQPVSEVSFSQDKSSDDLLSANRLKVQRGIFKLYHE